MPREHKNLEWTELNEKTKTGVVYFIALPFILPNQLEKNGKEKEKDFNDDVIFYLIFFYLIFIDIKYFLYFRSWDQPVRTLRYAEDLKRDNNWVVLSVD
jgi:hypothetical protein